jgi:hypothetical protein
MLLFRSEENVDRWCDAHRTPRRPLVRLDQLWHLATAWYANRLTPESRRPGPDEMVGVFAAVGLEGPFWDPKSDHWRSAP